MVLPLAGGITPADQDGPDHDVHAHGQPETVQAQIEDKNEQQAENKADAPVADRRDVHDPLGVAGAAQSPGQDHEDSEQRLENNENPKRFRRQRNDLRVVVVEPCDRGDKEKHHDRGSGQQDEREHGGLPAISPGQVLAARAQRLADQGCRGHAETKARHERQRVDVHRDRVGGQGHRAQAGDQRRVEDHAALADQLLERRRDADFQHPA